MTNEKFGQIIDGIALSARLRGDVAARAKALTTAGVAPGLAVILVGDDPASAVYVRNKVKACADTGVYSVFEKYEATLPEVFPELAPGSFTWEPELDGWVWTTFNSYQWDLNYANPEVFVEMFRVMVELANLGVEVLRKEYAHDAEQEQHHEGMEFLHALLNVVPGDQDAERGEECR